MLKGMFPLPTLFVGGYKDPFTGVYQAVFGERQPVTYFPAGFPTGQKCLGIDLSQPIGAFDYNCQSNTNYYACYMNQNLPSELNILYANYIN